MPEHEKPPILHKPKLDAGKSPKEPKPKEGSKPQPAREGEASGGKSNVAKEAGKSGKQAEQPKSQQAVASPEAVRIVEKARSPGGPLEGIVLRAPDQSPKLVEFLSQKIEAIKAGATTQEQALVELRENIKNGKVEPMSGTIVSLSWSQKINRPDLGIMIGGGAVSPLFDSATDLVGVTKPEELRLKLELQRYQNALDAQPLTNSTEDWKQRDRLLRRATEKLAMGKNPPKTGKPADFDPIQADKFIARAKNLLKEAEDKVNELSRKQYEEQSDKEISPFHLAPWEQKMVNSKNQGPMAFSEHWIAGLYASPESFAAEQASRRIDLMRDHIRSPIFKQSEWYKNQQRIHKFTNEQMEAYFNNELWEEISHFEESYTNLKYAYASFQQGTEGFKKVVEIIDRLGSRGWHSVYDGQHGFNGHAMQVYVQELESLRMGPNDERRRLLPADFIIAADQTEGRLMIERDQWVKMVKETTGEDIVLDARQVKFAARVGRALAGIRQKTALAVIKGLGPGESLVNNENMPEAERIFDNIHAAHGENGWSFVDAGPEEVVASAMDVYRFYMEKWTSLTPGQQRMLMYVGEFTSLENGFDVTIDKQLELWRSNGLYDQEKEKWLHKFWGEKKGGPGVFAHREIWAEAGHPGFMNEDKEFRRLLIMDKGVRDFFSKLLDMYDLDSSGWRGGLELQQIHGVFQHADEYALGFWLRRAGGNYLNANEENAEKFFDHGVEDEFNERKKNMNISVNGTTLSFPLWAGENAGDPSTAALSVKSVLGKIAEMQPHMSASMMAEQHHKGFNDWWRDANMQRLAKPFIKATGADPIGFNDVFKKLNKIHHMVDQRVSHMGLRRINYRDIASLDKTRKDIMEDVIKNVSFGGRPKGTMKTYTELMNKLSIFMGNDTQINAFKDAKFRTYFTRTQWTSDAFFDILEQPKKFAALGGNFQPNAAERLPLTQYKTKYGVGGRDPLSRAWGDLSRFGLPIVDKMRVMLTMNDKLLLKTVEELVESQRIYGGSESALRNILMVVTGREKFMKTDLLPSTFFLNGLPNSSEAKRYFGWEAPSVGVKEINDLYEELELIYSKFDLMPGVKKTYVNALQHLGIAWKYELNGVLKYTKLPFWGRQLYTATAIAALLIAIEAGKEGMSAGGSGNSGQSSH